MHINTDINILSNIPNFNLLDKFFNEKMIELIDSGQYHGFSEIKTIKSVRRFDSAVRKSLLFYSNTQVQKIVEDVYSNESISNDLLILLFWNLSLNNDLFNYLNENVYFPALYSGRISINSVEVKACIKDLQSNQPQLFNWPPNTVLEMASAYLRLLTKLGFLSGKMNKSFETPYLNDKMFVLFTYWIAAISDKPNLVNSPWLSYCFSEKQAFLDRLLQKKFSKYFNVVYTGDKLSIEPIIPYESIYEHITKS